MFNPPEIFRQQPVQNRAEKTTEIAFFAQLPHTELENIAQAITVKVHVGATKNLLKSAQPLPPCGDTRKRYKYGQSYNWVVGRRLRYRFLKTVHICHGFF